MTRCGALVNSAGGVIASVSVERRVRTPTLKSMALKRPTENPVTSRMKDGMGNVVGHDLPDRENLATVRVVRTSPLVAR